LFNLGLKKQYDTVTAWGGCAALIHLLKDRLKTAMKKSPQFDQVTELHELPELETMRKTLLVIIHLTYYSSEMGKFGVVAVGGVAAVVKAIKTFPKCQLLQRGGCGVLRNLTSSNVTGKKQLIESGGIELLLAAIHNHLDSALLCQHACSALHSILHGSKENTGRFISLGGAAAVANVRTKWPNNDDVQTQVRYLAQLIVAEMKAWVDEDK
jgi:hypothetical protein